MTNQKKSYLLRVHFKKFFASIFIVLFTVSCGGGASGGNKMVDIDNSNKDNSNNEEGGNNFYKATYPKSVSVIKGNEDSFQVRAHSIVDSVSSDKITYSLEKNFDGIYINSDTGVVTITANTQSSGKLFVKAANSLGSTSFNVDIIINEGIYIFNKTATGDIENLKDKYNLIEFNILSKTAVSPNTNIKILAIKNPDQFWSFTYVIDKPILDGSQISIKLPDADLMNLYWGDFWENKNEK